MTTRRERMEARAERREEWAEGRTAKAEARSKQASEKADMIPFGQPILVGHYSEGRDRNFRVGISRDFEKAHEHRRMADHHRSKADGIRSQLDRSIFSDDVDAIEQLGMRISELESERARIKAFNAACRKAKGSDGGIAAAMVEHLDEKQRNAYLSVVAHTPYSLGKNGEMPAYALSNLSGNINRNRKRLAQLQAERSDDGVQ